MQPSTSSEIRQLISCGWSDCSRLDAAGTRISPHTWTADVKSNACDDWECMMPLFHKRVITMRYNIPGAIPAAAPVKPSTWISNCRDPVMIATIHIGVGTSTTQLTAFPLRLRRKIQTSSTVCIETAGNQIFGFSSQACACCLEIDSATRPQRVAEPITTTQYLNNNTGRLVSSHASRMQKSTKTKLRRITWSITFKGVNPS